MEFSNKDSWSKEFNSDSSQREFLQKQIERWTKDKPPHDRYCIDRMIITWKISNHLFVQWKVFQDQGYLRLQVPRLGLRHYICDIKDIIDTISQAAFEQLNGTCVDYTIEIFIGNEWTDFFKK